MFPTMPYQEPPAGARLRERTLPQTIARGYRSLIGIGPGMWAIGTLSQVHIDRLELEDVAFNYFFR